MTTLTPLPILLRTNAAGEQLDNVDLHILIRDGLAMVSVSSLTCQYTQGVPLDMTSRHLLQMIASTELADFETRVSLKHFDEVVVAYNLMSLAEEIEHAGKLGLQMLTDELPIFEVDSPDQEFLVKLVTLIIEEEHPELVEHLRISPMPQNRMVAVTVLGSLNVHGSYSYFPLDQSIRLTCEQLRRTLAASYIATT